MLTTTPTELHERWSELRSQRPDLRIRNAAQELGVSEVQLLALGIGDGVVRLRPEFAALLAEVSTLGHVMALTRNDDVVHERKGTYLNASLDKGPVGLFVSADIDLRIFWGAWASAFAVNEPGPGGDRHSLQFFAHDGEAIHKIYLTEKSDRGAYDRLVERFRDADQSPTQSVQPRKAVPAEMPDSAIDVASFRTGWLELKDTHDFHMLVGGHRLSRTQALRLAPEGDFAVPVAPGALRAVLNDAAAQQVPIMVFVSNKGMLQIHTGPVMNIVDARGWLNVLDPEFNLHVREQAITSAWIVRKPTTDGTVTALECYDAHGVQIVQVFGKRKPGIPELESWRSLIATVQNDHKA
ncbi:MAG: hemin-degrading factor [Flavobacteriales bacterium]|jgi:putative hemin transport protein|nr:hemin-degrading factor [Flavobacteriales bacterium]MBK7083745.1 hemin-degrading factor [Flavobacteriales bacterium]MBK7269986.1 hemin-degrading factor [Flavobacteriales bacterium]MBK9076983.1 hemin-degrading factor [Flavobacteriales bacterium]MBK9538404.1 hemin-degrading factor [Flavobacteriales bacterium]